MESDGKYGDFRRQYEKSVLSCRYDSSSSIQDTTTLLRRDYKHYSVSKPDKSRDTGQLSFGTKLVTSRRGAAKSRFHGAL